MFVLDGGVVAGGEHIVVGWVLLVEGRAGEGVDRGFVFERISCLCLMCPFCGCVEEVRWEEAEVGREGVVMLQML